MERKKVMRFLAAFMAVAVTVTSPGTPVSSLVTAYAGTNGGTAETSDIVEEAVQGETRADDGDTAAPTAVSPTEFASRLWAKVTATPHTHTVDCYEDENAKSIVKITSENKKGYYYKEEEGSTVTELYQTQPDDDKIVKVTDIVEYELNGNVVLQDTGKETYGVYKKATSDDLKNINDALAKAAIAKEESNKSNATRTIFELTAPETEPDSSSDVEIITAAYPTDDNAPTPAAGSGVSEVVKEDGYYVVTKYTKAKNDAQNLSGKGWAITIASGSELKSGDSELGLAVPEEDSETYIPLNVKAFSDEESTEATVSGTSATACDSDGDWEKRDIDGVQTWVQRLTEQPGEKYVYDSTEKNFVIYVVENADDDDDLTKVDHNTYTYENCITGESVSTPISDTDKTKVKYVQSAPDTYYYEVTDQYISSITLAATTTQAVNSETTDFNDAIVLHFGKNLGADEPTKADVTIAKDSVTSFNSDNIGTYKTNKYVSITQIAFGESSYKYVASEDNIVDSAEKVKTLTGSVSNFADLTGANAQVDLSGVTVGTTKLAIPVIVEPAITVAPSEESSETTATKLTNDPDGVPEDTDYYEATASGQKVTVKVTTDVEDSDWTYVYTDTITGDAQQATEKTYDASTGIVVTTKGAHTITVTPVYKKGTADEVRGTAETYEFILLTPATSGQELDIATSQEYTGSDIVVSPAASSDVVYSYRVHSDDSETETYTNGLPKEVGTYDIKVVFKRDYTTNFTSENTKTQEKVTVTQKELTKDAGDIYVSSSNSLKETGTSIDLSSVLSGLVEDSETPSTECTSSASTDTKVDASYNNSTKTITIKAKEENAITDTPETLTYTIETKNVKLTVTAKVTVTAGAVVTFTAKNPVLAYNAAIDESILASFYEASFENASDGTFTIQYRKRGTTDALQNLTTATTGLAVGTYDYYVNYKREASEPTYTAAVGSTSGTMTVGQITLKPTTITLDVDKYETLEATIEPESLKNETVTWASDATGYATVASDGKVTAAAEGSANITATVGSTAITATCAVTVTPKATKVTLSDATLSIEAGSKKKITATVEPTNTTDKTATWNSSDTSVATVADDGTITAVAEGTANITATVQGIESAACVVTVTAKKSTISSTVTATGITLSSTTLALKAGETSTLTATVAPQNASNKTVTWTTSDAKVATVADGKVTAVANGTATITAKTANGLTATCTVTVTTDVTGITLDVTTLALKVGDKSTLKATVAPETASDTTVTWQTSDATIATVSDGTVTAVAAGSATITASVGTFSATCTVTVTADEQATGVTLNKTSLALKVGKSSTLKATVEPETAADTTIQWSSSDAKVASVDENGKVTAVANGTATITAKTANGLTATCKVTVTTDVSSVKLNKTSLTVVKGKTATLKATVNPDTASDKKLTWSSSDKSVATVDKNGKVTAKKGGSATITVKSSNGKKATCKVTVADVTLNASSFTLQVGKTTTALQATSTVKGDKVKSWTSSDKKVATVTSSGKIKGVKAGTATITVKMNSGATAKCKVTVQKKAVTTKSIKLSDTKLTVKKGKTATLTVTRNPISATEKITWTSSNTKIATVDKNGKVTAKKKGTVTITAKTSNGKKATCKVTVK